MGRPPLLFKYLPPERVDCLPELRLRFTQPLDFNDPFESRPFVGLHPRATEVPPHWTERASRSMAALVRSVDASTRSTVLRDLFTSTSKELRGLLQTQGLAFTRDALVHVFRERYGVLSLSEQVDSLLMWAHYAKGHTGFALGFDGTHPFFESARSVEYRDLRPDFRAADLVFHEVFFVKSREWSYEHEWRAIRLLTASDTVIRRTPLDIHLVKIPAQAVSQIILGSRSPASLALEARAAFSSGGAGPTFLRVREDPRHFRLNVEPLDS